MMIITLSPSRWKEYKRLRLQALADSPRAFATTFNSQKSVADKEWKKRLTRYYKGKGNWMLFAESNKKLVGMMGAYQTAADRKQKTAHLIAVFVVKEARKKGIGKQLLAELLKTLAKARIKKIILAVNPKQKAALALYASSGFVKVGKEKVVLGDGKMHEEYMMELDISHQK